MESRGITTVPVPGLVRTFEVTAPDGTVLGVIAKADDYQWCVLSARYGTEPDPVRYPSRWAAALALVHQAQIVSER